MTLTIRPATVFDLLNHSARNDPANWVMLREMHDKGDVWIAEDADGFVAMGGVHPLGDGAGEVWFATGLRAGKYIRQIVSLMRLTLASLPYDLLVIPHPNRAGRILARRLGFADEGNNIWMR